MIKRYPCQAVILFVLGILAAKGAVSCRDSGCLDTGILLPAASAAAALLSAAVWAGRERIWQRKICLAAVLAAAFGTGMLRMYDVSNALEQRTAGIADGQRAAVQGKIIKKQCKEALYADSEEPDRNNSQKQYAGHISNLNTYYAADMKGSINQKLGTYQKSLKITKPNSVSIPINKQEARPAYHSMRSIATASIGRQETLPEYYSMRNIATASINKQETLPADDCGQGLASIDFNKLDPAQGHDPVSAESKQWTVYLKDAYLRTEEGIRFCGNVIVYLKCSEPVIGNTVLLSGQCRLFQAARNDGSFDERAYYQNQGYSFKIYADDNSCRTADTHKDMAREFLYALQQKLMQVYSRAMPQQEAGALSAMLLGDKSLLPGQTKELYRQSGISHILAISGLHISILGASMYHLLRKRGVSYLHASVIAMGMLFLFVLMTGIGLSSVRAVVMFGMYLGAECAGRAYDSVNGLAAAAACILACNPRALFLAGFQFSFAAVAGVLFGREICRIFQPRLRLAETVMISAGIQVFTLPLTAWYYFEIPLYSVLLNLLVLPFVEIVLITGLFGGGFGLVHGIFGLLSDGLLSVCTWMLRYFAKAGELFLELPGAVYVIGRPKIWQMVCYYLIAAGSVWIMAWAADKSHEQCASVQCRTASGGHEAFYFYLRLQKFTAFFCMLSCLGLIFARLPRRQEVALLDVGQGDGIYIHTSDGMDIFIDGGSTDVKDVGTYRILPFLKSHGISGIDLWFVSHLDKDHISGLKEIADSGYPIGQVVLAEGIVQDDAYHDLLDMLEGRQVPVCYLGRGEKLHGAHACFTCLWPSDASTADDRNAASLALLYEDSGFRAFFSGDISAGEEKRLLAGQDLMHVTLYKAAHHGSKYSNSQEILQQLQPDVSVVSCAAENDYGHPGREAVKIMEEYSGDVYYTMRSGQVRIWRDRKGVFVQEGK